MRYERSDFRELPSIRLCAARGTRDGKLGVPNLDSVSPAWDTPGLRAIKACEARQLHLLEAACCAAEVPHVVTLGRARLAHDRAVEMASAAAGGMADSQLQMRIAQTAESLLAAETQRDALVREYELRAAAVRDRVRQLIEEYVDANLRARRNPDDRAQLELVRTSVAAPASAVS